MTKTYLQLAREIATLQAAADKQLAAEKKEAVAGLNEVIAKYGLSAADLKFAGTGSSAAKPGANAKSTSKPAVSGAKYADGTGNTWGGRGPRPAWLRNAIAAGKTLESFLGSAAPAAQPVAATASASASDGSRKRSGFAVAPKYRHPATGDTWSGRGSAPRWLKEALRKRGTQRDDFLIAKPAAAVSSDKPAKPSKSVAAPKPVASAKAAPVKAPAARKAVVSKTLPKSAPAAKKPVAKKSAKTPTPAPVVTPKKTMAAKKQAVSAPQREATSSKPARKAVAAKKKTTTKSAPAANAGVLSAAAPSVSSSASETPAASPVV